MHFLLFCLLLLPISAFTQSSPIAFAIHGGAGFVDSNKVSPELRARYRMVLSEAALTGYGILKKGGTSLEAVEAAIRILEDSPLFNAGRGAVTNAEGFCELDASIMDGSSRQAGAVAGLTTVKNPITLARLVKDSTKHVLLMGEGAERFASQMPVQRVERSYFLERDPDKKGEVPGWLHDAKFGTVVLWPSTAKATWRPEPPQVACVAKSSAGWAMYPSLALVPMPKMGQWL